jgi:hypothetical protein
MGAGHEQRGRDPRFSPANGSGLPLGTRKRTSPSPTRPAARRTVAPPVSYAHERRGSGRHARLALQPPMNFPIGRWREKFMPRGCALSGALPTIRPTVPAYHRQTARGIALARDEPRIDPPAYGPPLASSVGWVAHLPVESGDSVASDLIQMPQTTNFPKCCARKIRTARRCLKREAVPSYDGLALAEAAAQNRAPPPPPQTPPFHCLHQVHVQHRSHERFTNIRTSGIVLANA